MAYDPARHHRRSIRLKDYDYAAEGLYFITLVCHDRKHLFGEIIDGIMYPNEYGRIAEKHWLNTPNLRPNISLGPHIIMPNHIHGIISIDYQVSKGGPKPAPTENREEEDRGEPLSTSKGGPQPAPTGSIGSIIRGYKAAVTKEINILRLEKGEWRTDDDLYRSKGGQPSTRGKGWPQPAPTSNQRRDGPPPVWQRNYYEHIIRDDRAYQNIANYILNNPAKWTVDRFGKNQDPFL